MRVGRTRTPVHGIVRSPDGIRRSLPEMSDGTWGVVTTGDGVRNRQVANRRRGLRAEATPLGDTP